VNINCLEFNFPLSNLGRYCKFVSKRQIEEKPDSEWWFYTQSIHNLDSQAVAKEIVSMATKNKVELYAICLVDLKIFILWQKTFAWYSYIHVSSLDEIYSTEAEYWVVSRHQKMRFHRCPVACCIYVLHILGLVQFLIH